VAGIAEPLRSPVLALAGRPGKLLRPLLVAASGASGTPDSARLTRLGALVELLHLASLLHDDMIDKAATRRGGRAVHAVIGHDQAMLAGLACFAQAGMEAADLGGGLDRVVSSTVARISYGELLDVERAFDVELPIPDYLSLVELKTGQLFRLSCLLGAQEAGAGDDAVGVLAAFGSQLGVTFQILDDCLDFAAHGTGKPTGTDHMMGVFGAPTLYALAADTSGQLAALLLSPELRPADMPRVREMVVGHGGLAAAAHLARQRYHQALSVLSRLPPGARRDLLVQVADMAWREPA
jgi:heptaprenyl diphosphate synthase